MKHYDIGWDVGAWKTKMGDAIWILDAEGNSVHQWKGNIGETLDADNIIDFIRELFNGKASAVPEMPATITLGIDAPLGFSRSFRNLLKRKPSPVETDKQAIQNPYLFRATERFVFKNSRVSDGLPESKGLARIPFSALQNSIGSQSTKAIHFLAKFGFKRSDIGVWKCEHEGMIVQAIEVYPATCKTRIEDTNHVPNPDSKRPRKRTCPGPLLHYKDAYDKILANFSEAKDDEKDALICALIARAFRIAPESLHAPVAEPEASIKEGWIWFPK